MRRHWLSLAVLGVLTGSASALSPWDFGGPAYQRGFPSAPQASFFGYNLDDTNPGYYGGGRYREYYAYGRGYGIANFPGPLPNYPRGYIPKSMRGYPSPWSEPRPTIFVRGDAAAAPCTVEIHLPDGAEVWIDGEPTKQTGAQRTFVTPALHGGLEYSYSVRARWETDGQVVEQSRSVDVRAGDHVAIVFPRPTGGNPTTLPAEITRSVSGDLLPES
jgi:uncharacterized protein (TIGR03000 family)